MLQDDVVPIQTARMMPVSLVISYLHQQPRQVGAHHHGLNFW
jgi:hypothetical protein